MTLLEDRPETPTGGDVSGEHGDGDHGAHHEGPRGILLWMTSTDHKIIGLNYMITSLVMFFMAGGMALVIRIQLSSPAELVPLVPDLQRALHDAREPDALPLRRAVRIRRARELHRPAAGRRAGHGVPEAERLLLLAVPERVDLDAPRLLHRRWCRRLRMGRLRPALQRRQLTGVGCRPLDPRPRADRASRRSSPG